MDKTTFNNLFEIFNSTNSHKGSIIKMKIDNFIVNELKAEEWSLSLIYLTLNNIIDKQTGGSDYILTHYTNGNIIEWNLEIHGEATINLILGNKGKTVRFIEYFLDKITYNSLKLKSVLNINS